MLVLKRYKRYRIFKKFLKSPNIRKSIHSKKGKKVKYVASYTQDSFSGTVRISWIQNGKGIHNVVTVFDYESTDENKFLDWTNLKRRLKPSFLKIQVNKYEIPHLDLKQTNFNGISTSNDVNKIYYHTTI